MIYSLQIKFFQVGCGDAISIRFLGNDKKHHNILVDGGINKWYEHTFQKEIKSIIDKKEIIDLWIITHTDSDHIGGILRFIKDEKLRNKIDLTQTQYWFNYLKNDYDTGLRNTTAISVGQGIKLRRFLSENAKLCEHITNEISPIDFFGAKLTILSPTKEKLDKALNEWEEKKSTNISAKPNDYKIKLEDFNLSNFKEDNSKINGSSIAFLLEYQDKRILFLADSHPSTIVAALKKLGFDKRKLKLDWMQIAHHGSKFNTSDDILQMIDCQNFIISSDGTNRDNLPHKETLARIIKNYPNKEIKFIITHKTKATKSIFDVDTNLQSVICEFANSENAIIINYTSDESY